MYSTLVLGIINLLIKREYKCIIIYTPSVPIYKQKTQIHTY